MNKREVWWKVRRGESAHEIDCAGRYRGPDEQTNTSHNVVTGCLYQPKSQKLSLGFAIRPGGGLWPESTLCKR